MSATELRKMPLPTKSQIRAIGQAVQTEDSEPDLDLIDSIVTRVFGFLSRASKSSIAADNSNGGIKGMVEQSQEPTGQARLPLQGVSVEMTKLEEAQDILIQFGLPDAQQNRNACLTLLSLAGVSKDTEWWQRDETLSHDPPDNRFYKGGIRHYSSGEYQGNGATPGHQAVRASAV